MEGAERKLERGGQAGRRNEFQITNSFGKKREKTNGRLMAVSRERDRMLATIAQKEVEIQEGKVQLEGGVALVTLKNEMERKVEIPKLVIPKLEMPKLVTYTQAT